MRGDRGWQIATCLVIAVWLVAIAALMIADVWDETNGMLLFSGSDRTLGEKVRIALTEPLGFWRPIPTLIAALVLHAIPDFDVSWRLLRGLNAVLLLAAFAAMVCAVRTAEPERRSSPPLEFALAVAFLFSGSAIITAGWYAPIFDAAALALVMLGLLLLLRGQDLAGGLAIGTAFFCKEPAILALPFLLMLFAGGRITLRQALRSGIPAVLLGAAYFAIRARLIPFGSSADVHGFARADLAPTFVNLAESFWRQTLKGSGPGILGFVWLALSLAALRKPQLVAATLALLAGTGVIYWGMFSEWQNGALMHHLNFVGRLYLMPAALILLMLALERRTAAIAILCVPILLGGWATWRDNAEFQRVYARIYALAPGAKREPLSVHYPIKPLDDTVRNIRIGDLPDADLRLDPRSGLLLRGGAP